MTSLDTEYEWNALRKVWHLAGCLLMIAIFYSWKDIRGPVPGRDVMVCFAWFETAVALAIDLMRFYSPRSNDIVGSLPFYGKLMRNVEKNHFNASTYYLLAAAILVTAYRFGYCRETTLIAALMVLGVADPAAAWTRYQAAKHGLGHEDACGAAAFLAASLVAMALVNMRLGGHFAMRHILCVAAIVAIVESYTKYWVLMLHPLTQRVQRHIRYKATTWLFRLYPDDNLLIPLTVALLLGILPWFI